MTETPTPIPTAVRLPVELEDHDTLAELEPVHTVYTVPWAMDNYGVNGCYLNGAYHYTRQVFGTSNMRVTRAQQGYIVQRSTDFRYRKAGGFPNPDDVPVIGFENSLLP